MVNSFSVQATNSRIEEIIQKIQIDCRTNSNGLGVDADAGVLGFAMYIILSHISYHDGDRAVLDGYSQRKT